MVDPSIRAAGGHNTESRTRGRAGRQRTHLLIVVHLLAAKNQPLLRGRNALLLLDTLL